MSEEKKDLTGILDLTKASQASISHQAGKDVTPPMEQPPVEQVDSFESSDEFQKSGLTNAPATDAQAVDAPMENAPPTTEPVPSDFPASTDFVTTPESETQASDLPPVDMDMGSTNSTPPADIPPMDFNAVPESTVSEQRTIPSATSFNSIPEPTQTGEAKISSGVGTESQLYPNPPVSFGDVSNTPTQTTPTGMSGVKQRSENTSLMRRAALKPFDFTMTGFLDPLNLSKFKDIVLKNNLGLTADDLVIQFKSGKIKLPRISEYVGTYLIQTFRDARVDMKLIPQNDPDITTNEIEPKIYSHSDGSTSTLSSSLADNIQITSGEILPAYKDWEIVDTLTASIGLTSEAIEVERTDLYSQAVDSLKREMRLRAFHKGASAIILFNVSMVRLTLPTHYKIFAVGTAINRIGTG